MKARREYRNRDRVEVTVLDALVERNEEGMTVFELRASAEVDIDELETALGELKADDLIEVESDGERTVIKPDERVVPDPDEDHHEPSFLDQVIERLRF